MVWYTLPLLRAVVFRIKMQNDKFDQIVCTKAQNVHFIPHFIALSASSN